MKLPLNYLGFFLCLFLASCQKQVEPKAPDFEAMKVKFMAENKNWSNSAKTNDATYIANLYNEDAILGIPFQPFVEGKNQIAKKWQNTVEMVDDLGFETKTLSGTNEIVYETGLAFTSYTVQGVSKTDTSKYVIVWEKQGNGKYKIAVDLFNQIKPISK